MLTPYRSVLTGLLGLLVAAPALAGGGPHNVLIVANARSEDSMAVANAYRAARGIPQRNLCVVDLRLKLFRHSDSVTAEDFEAHLAGPLKAFLSRHPAADRLHYVVLCPDLPLRMRWPKPAGTRSLPASLMLFGTVPSAAQRRNPYLLRPHAFEKLALPPGSDDPVGRLRLVTVLRGYERHDALAMVTRSVAADRTAPDGTFYFVPSQHTRKFEETAAWLTGRGLKAVLTGRGKPVSGAADVMAYLSGGSYSGLAWNDITSNTYRPGALVDMLESWGATWQNWRGFGYPRQVPVPWFIRAGATGVHGATDEPYAMAFPSTGRSQLLFTNYLAGCNLAEAYWSAIPTVQWQNVVFGDPLCAPYAVRSDVHLDVDPPTGDASTHQARVRITECNAAGKPKEARFFVDGHFVGATGDLMVRADGAAEALFDIDAADLADGWHRLRAVVVDDAPAAVQSWAVSDFQTGPKAGVLQLKLVSPAAAVASGDTVKLRVRRSGRAVSGSVALLAGDRQMAKGTGNELALDTAGLGPGRHGLQAAVRDAEGHVVALSNFLALDLIEPLHVVRNVPAAATGRRPVFMLEYDRPLPFTDTVAQRAVRLTQNKRTVPVRCTVQDRVLAVDALAPLRPGTPARLEVGFPQKDCRSRAFTQTVTPTDDAQRLYTMTLDAKYRGTVLGVTWSDSKQIKPVWDRPAKVVLGPVDVYSAKRPARCALSACGVSATLTVNEKARPEGQDAAGAGLGVLYSDIDNHCYARVERTQVVVYQVLGAKQTRLASWPAPAATTGDIPMAVTCAGPRVTVTVHGKVLGSVEVDRHMPPGLPWIDLGAPKDVVASQVKVFRP